MPGRLRIAATVVAAFITSTLTITSCFNTSEEFDEEELDRAIAQAEREYEAKRDAKREATSDVRALGEAISATTQDSGYPRDLDQVIALEGVADLHQDSVVATYSLLRFSDRDGFFLCIENAGHAHARYYSDNGAVTASTGPCPVL